MVCVAVLVAVGVNIVVPFLKLPEASDLIGVHIGELSMPFFDGFRIGVQDFSRFDGF